LFTLTPNFFGQFQKNKGNAIYLKAKFLGPRLKLRAILFTTSKLFGKFKAYT
jgi:hypothetical protein